MAVFLGAFPVLPGKEDEVRKFAQETAGRSEEFAASQKKNGITSEEWSLQETPMGSLTIVRFECNDVEAAFGNFGASTDPFDVWFKEQVKATSGVDLNVPEGPPPEVIFEWRA